MNYRKSLSIFLFVFCLLFSISVSARVRVNGIAQKGAKSVKTSPTTTFKLMETFPNCTVTVYLTGTLTLATIYSDNAGTLKSNPFTSSSDASFFFYIDDGRYDIKFSGTGIVTPFTISDLVAIGDILNVPSGIYDITNYGNDLQATIDAVPSATSGEVRINGANIILSKPLIIDKIGLSIGGINGNSNASRISSSGAFYGPLIYALPINYPSITPRLQTSLVTGSGSSYDLNPVGSDSQSYINLSDSSTLNLNGLSQLAVEFFIKPTHDSTGEFNFRDILTSNGKLSTNGTATSAFYITQYVDNTVRAVVTTSNGTVTLNSPVNSLLLNQVQHIALTYSGTTVRLFINGILQTSSALTGTIKQEPHERVVLGIARQGWPEVSTTSSSADGLIDSIRFSNTARYTANFTNPSAKFGVDANTLLLMNFDSFYRGLVIAKTNSTTTNFAYIPYRTCGLCNGALMTGLKIHDLNITGSVYITSAIKTNLENLTITHSSGVGLWLYDNTYLSWLKNINITSFNPSLSGLIIAQASGVIEIDKVDILGGTYQVAMSTSSATLNNLFLAPNQYTKYSGVFKGGGEPNAQYTFTYPIIDHEFVPIVAPLGNLLFDTPSTAVINGGILEMNAPAPYVIPNVVIDGGKNYTFTGIHFNNPQLGEVVKFVSAPSEVVTLNNPYKSTPTQPYGTGADLNRIQISSNGNLTIGIVTTFATLGTPSNSTFTYCSDCTAASNPCTGSGTGTFAFRLAGAWKCL